VSEFAQLPGSASEATALTSWAKQRDVAVETLSGPAATASNLRKWEAKKLESIRYLHFATHGKASRERGLSSFLALSPDPDAPAHFSRLTAAEILKTWKLNADLVTLSACETALGQKQGGEGFLGFSQALLGAGARTLVLSQGPVNDHAATLLMIRFYQELRPSDGRSVSKLEALTAARHWLRSLSRREAISALHDAPESWLRRLPAGSRPFEHPHYWASFVLVGLPD
jgi:CHAT domain-containing protein